MFKGDINCSVIVRFWVAKITHWTRTSLLRLFLKPDKFTIGLVEQLLFRGRVGPFPGDGDASFPKVKKVEKVLKLKYFRFIFFYEHRYRHGMFWTNN